MKLESLLMRMEPFNRLIQLIGQEKFIKLQKLQVIVFGVGGVGGQVVESLVRSGFINITVVDHDVIEATNLNRQVIATLDAVGLPKVEVLKKRMLLINPCVKINTLLMEVTQTNAETFNLEKYDYIVDAIDSMQSKLSLINYSLKRKQPIISAMGAGNRIDPTKVKIMDIEKTVGCPLAKIVRVSLRKNKLSGLKVVASEELPLDNNGGKPGSSAFVPPAFGLAIASYIFSESLKT